MLEGCRSLMESDTKIEDFITLQEASLLSDVPLTEGDVAWLDIQIRDRLRQDAQAGTRFLMRRAPLSLAAFLIWQGIRQYREGESWSAVHSATGVADARYQSKWGQAFPKTLLRYNLLIVGNDPGHAYVRPILLHGGVPDSCIPEYFREENSELETAGWVIIISNDIDDAKRAMRIYREKDVIEKGFLRLKRSLDLGRSRVHSQESMQNKVFIGFIALVLLSELHKVMSDKDMYKSITLKQLIHTLSRHRIQDINGTRIIYTATKEQRNIYKAFKVGEPV